MYYFQYKLSFVKSLLYDTCFIICFSIDNFERALRETPTLKYFYQLVDWSFENLLRQTGSKAEFLVISTVYNTIFGRLSNLSSIYRI